MKSRDQRTVCADAEYPGMEAKRVREFLSRRGSWRPSALPSARLRPMPSSRRTDHRHPPAPGLQRPSGRRAAGAPAGDGRDDDDPAAGRPAGQHAVDARRRVERAAGAVPRQRGVPRSSPRRTRMPSVRRQRGARRRGRDAGDRAVPEPRGGRRLPSRSSASSATRRRCRRSTTLAAGAPACRC